MDCEKSVMDLDHFGTTLKMVGGMEVAPGSPSPDFHLVSGPGEKLLSTAHTMARFASDNIRPGIAEAGPFET